MCSISYIAHYAKWLFFPSKWVYHRITEQFDKSGFDEVVQFLELLTPVFNNGIDSIKNLNHFALVFSVFGNFNFKIAKLTFIDYWNNRCVCNSN